MTMFLLTYKSKTKVKVQFVNSVIIKKKQRQYQKNGVGGIQGQRKKIIWREQEEKNTMKKIELSNKLGLQENPKVIGGKTYNEKKQN